MSSELLLSYRAIEDPEIPVRVCNHFSYKPTSAIVRISTIPAYGQSTSNVSNHGEITHLTGALYHHLQALEIPNLR
jgi:hypothetical protein